MPLVIPKTLAEIELAIRGAWSAETRDPSDDWSPANPASGQCGVTALVLNDIFGGDLLVAEVQYVDGTHQGYSSWNRFAGAEVDETAWAATSMRGAVFTAAASSVRGAEPSPVGTPVKSGEIRSPG